MRSKKFITVFSEKNISLQLKKFYRSTAIVAGMSSLLVAIFVTGIVASMGSIRS